MGPPDDQKRRWAKKTASAAIIWTALTKSLVRLHITGTQKRKAFFGYSKQPTIEEMMRLHMNYILTAKPDDHKKLIEWVGEMRILTETTQFVVRDGAYTHRYEWINEVPLNDNKNTIMVNYIEYWMEKDGEVTYRNSSGD